MKQWIGAVLLGAGMCAFLAGCGSSSTPAGGSASGGGGTSSSSGASSGSSGGAASAKTYTICPGPDAQKEALIAFFDAHEGDTIHFCAGQFDFTASLVMPLLPVITRLALKLNWPAQKWMVSPSWASKKAISASRWALAPQMT